MRKPAAAVVSVAWGVALGVNLRLPASLSAERLALSPAPALLGGRAGGGRAAHLRRPRPHRARRLPSSSRLTGPPCRWLRRHAWW